CSGGWCTVADPTVHRGRHRRGLGAYALRVLVVGYLFLLVAWPLYLVGRNAFADGLTDLREILTDPDAGHALSLTGQVALASLAINTAVGVGISLLLVRYRFPGKRALNALLDLPLSVSPIVVGLALVLVYNGRT